MNGAQDLFRAMTRNLSFDRKKFQPQLQKLGLIQDKEVPQKEEAAVEINEPEVAYNEPSDDSEGSEDQSDGNDRDVKKKKKKRKKSHAKLQTAACNKHLEEMRKLRKEHGITVEGADIPDPISDFYQLTSQYQINEKLVQSLLRQGYTEPTAVQMQCWSLMLKNREVIATAPTGSGKTAAFLLPILHHLKGPRALGFRALIVAPTRELAEQTYRECCFLAKEMHIKVHLIDKVDRILKKFGPESSQKFDVLVTTPNRLVYILKEDTPPINFDNIEWLIMDECDRLFEGGKSGFRDQLSIIYQACSGPKVKRGFFSATHSYAFQMWCLENFDNLAIVTIGQKNIASKDVEQSLVYCGEESGKMYALRDILRKGFEPPCLIFVQSKERARQLFKELVYDDYTVDAIHAERTQKQREDCVKAFRAKKLWILICTELMSRGIDFKGVNLVINYDFPPTLVSYIHRIGRTGRAQNKGKAITFWTNEDQVNLGWLARNIKASGGSVPEWMLSLRKLGKHEKKAAQRSKERGFVSNSAKYTQLEADNRKKKRISMQLNILRKKGEGDSEKSEQLKRLLRKVVGRQKQTFQKEMQIADKEDNIRKTQKQKSKLKRENKKQKEGIKADS